ncbi:MAG: NAD(P)-binding domain-containing protein [Planctomycetes bacterium]|nr:NAD(P)-binding domain-containing protein [Planctomycetota bacterium]
MSWSILAALTLALCVAVLTLWKRRVDRAELDRELGEREKAKAQNTHRARLQYPQVDLSQCIGCGSCVSACPEDGVLGLVHGQAVVLHGARCVGHGRCADACPVGAIAITLGDLRERRDIPVLTEKLEATRVPNLFLAGEVTGYALIRTAVSHGTSVADEIGRRVARARRTEPAPSDVLDLVVVGAGPAGLACSLQAKVRGLRFVTLEQSDLGGTVSKYPRRKLVMTQPVELPLAGTLGRSTYQKEELVELWTRVAREQQLPIQTGEAFQGLALFEDGTFQVRSTSGAWHARHVCLALGRRGTPNKLGVPGEELAKVAYNLLDAHSYTDRRILVVGGGDSAIEAALGLAEQPGNVVTLSYRQGVFTRLKTRNEARLLEAVQRKRIELALKSRVERIEPATATLVFDDGARRVLDNDEMFVFAGGQAPQALLEQVGVSFDPAERAPGLPIQEQGTGLFRALLIALFLTLMTVSWTFVFRGYYGLDAHERPFAREHAWLKPTSFIGLMLGVAATVCVLGNLSYLARRWPRFDRIPGSLQQWMTAHVATGIGALLFALVHAAMAPRHTVGGHALWAMAFLVVTGAIGRYFYAFVPRAANGRELALDEVKTELTQLSGEWDRQRPEFAQRVREEIQRLIAEGRWQGSFAARWIALLRSQRRLSASLVRLRVAGAREGLASEQLDALVAIARRAQRTALMAAHYEDLRGLMSSWRWFHRWVALAMVLLVALHVLTALRYASFGGS